MFTGRDLIRPDINPGVRKLSPYYIEHTYVCIHAIYFDMYLYVSVSVYVCINVCMSIPIVMYVCTFECMRISIFICIIMH